MVFIRDNVRLGKNPVDELRGGVVFTFGVVSSKELASPEELVLKKKLDEVGDLLF